MAVKKDSSIQDLEAARQQLLQLEKTRSLGTLSAGVAHHFNSLLSIILGYASFVLNREKVTSESAEALHKVCEAAQRGRRLTEEILAFSGSDTEEEVACPIHETINAVLSLLQAQSGHGIHVESRLEAAHDTVMALPSSIRQIVFNLLSNALDGITPQGGKLSVFTANVELSTGTGKQQFVRLEVADSSGSIPEGFKPQKNGSAPSKVPLDGDRIGLRLSSVYGMVGRLDGTVLISSEPGMLTRVEVLLPVHSAREKEAAKEKKVRRRLAPSTLWVVDDDPIFREMCKQVLSEEGHTVEGISDGRGLREKWQGHKGSKPDLIIIDFSMPEYNGLQLCEWLRGQGAKVPVILVSGFAANQPDIGKALKMRKTYFLQKPFSSRDLADTVTVAMGETLIGQ